MKRQPLTVAIMARNEDWFIKHTLESALKVSDDVLVGDMESVDDTAKISESMGARVVTVPTKVMVEGGWAVTRNWISDRAKHDWVMVLDADEVISVGGCEILNREEWPWSTEVIVTPTYKYMCDNKMTMEEARKTKINKFPHRRMYNRQILEWKGIIHEELYYKEGGNSHSADKTDVIREHFTHMRTVARDGTWRWTVDAQLWVRAVDGDLPKEGVDPWWFNTWMKDNIEVQRLRAAHFFKTYPEFEYLRSQEKS